MRAYLARYRLAWPSPKHVRVVMVLLLSGALLASATLVSGAGPPSRAAHPEALAGNSDR